jgi:hypothetical protein
MLNANGLYYKENNKINTKVKYLRIIKCSTERCTWRYKRFSGGRIKLQQQHDWDLGPSSSEDSSDTLHMKQVLGRTQVLIIIVMMMMMIIIIIIVIIIIK